MKIKNIIILFLGIMMFGCGPSTEQVNNDKLFNSIKSVTDKLDQFEGTAYIGNIQGTCYMVLKEGKEEGDRREKIMRLRYEVVNIYAGTGNVVDETFIVTDLVKKEQTVESLGFKVSEKYANDYIEGKFKGLKSTIDGGAIEDGSGEGRIIFAIDSINKEFRCFMFGTGDYSYQAGIDLTADNHIQVKKIFKDSISAEEENRILSAYEVLELNSDELIDMGNGKYKAQLSKKDIINKTFSKRNGDGTTSYETKKMKLFSFLIKNVSEDTYNQMKINQRFSFDEYERTTEQQLLYNITRGSSLDFAKIVNNVKPNDMIQFTFYLSLKPIYITGGENKLFPYQRSDDGGGYKKHNLAFVKPVELFENEKFLSVFNKAIELPLIEFSGDGSFFSTKIYIELVD